MRVQQYGDPVSIPSGQYVRMRGSWDPSKGFPTNPQAFDMYSVCANYEGYEAGDFIVRNKDNTEYRHIRNNIYSYILVKLGSLIQKAKSDLKFYYQKDKEEIIRMLTAQNTANENIQKELLDEINALKMYIASLRDRLEAGGL